MVAAVIILMTNVERMTKRTEISINCFKLGLRKAMTCQIHNIWIGFVFTILNAFLKNHYPITDKTPWGVMFRPLIHHHLKDMIHWLILARLKLLWGLVVMISFLLLVCSITVTQMKLDLHVPVESLSLMDQLAPPLSLSVCLVARTDQTIPPCHSQLA